MRFLVSSQVDTVSSPASRRVTRSAKISLCQPGMSVWPEDSWQIESQSDFISWIYSGRGSEAISRCVIIQVIRFEYKFFCIVVSIEWLYIEWFVVGNPEFTDLTVMYDHVTRSLKRSEYLSNDDQPFIARGFRYDNLQLETLART